MLSYFHDTSSISKHYHAETGSAVVDHLLATSDARHVISRISLVELPSAFYGKVRTGAIDQASLQLLVDRFRADLQAKMFTVIRILNRHLDVAQTLIHRHGVARRIRTLDAMHLAVALDVHSKEPLTGFVCADDVLCHIASAEGLLVIKPK